MSFSLPFALLLGLFMTVVVLAHALRKGRAEPLSFPGTRLVIAQLSAAQKRQRIEDPWLMLLRLLLVGGLALLAASPFVSCTRLTLTRTGGASLAAVFIIDDSASMQASVDGASRLEQAQKAAARLVADAQPGDSFSLVLAGSPARVLLPSTTDLNGVREALAGIRPSDRGTDIKGALTLARGLGAAAEAPQSPILLFSDLSGTDLDDLDLTGVAVPNVGLTQPLSNCALSRATWGEQNVLVEIACTDAAAISGRTLSLEDEQGVALGAAVPARDGTVVVPVSKSTREELMSRFAVVHLSRQARDHIKSDDHTVVLSAPSRLSVAVHADIAKAGVKTAADTVLQSGLEALERGLRVQPLSLLPDEPAELAEHAALLIDDPPGFSPEVRHALAAWVKRGGVAMVLLGPAVSRTPLGSNFEPFLDEVPSWVERAPSGTSADQPGTLGPLTTTWSDLHARGHAVLSSDTRAEVIAAWQDGSPLITTKALGRGLLVTSTLPSSVDVSDFVLRPAYLELLDHIVTQASIRLGSAATPVGQRWRVPKAAMVRSHAGHVLTPVLAPVDPNSSSTGAHPREQEWVVEPDRAGAYRISGHGEQSLRYATRLAEEHTAQPRLGLASSASEARVASRSQVGISREVASALLLLSLIELCVRAVRREKRSSGRPNLHPTTT